MQNLGNI